MWRAREGQIKGRVSIINKGTLARLESCVGGSPASRAFRVGRVAAVAIQFANLGAIGDGRQDFIQRVIALIVLVGYEALAGGDVYGIAVSQAADRGQKPTNDGR